MDNCVVCGTKLDWENCCPACAASDLRLCRQTVARLAIENHALKCELAALNADNAEKMASMKTNAMRPNGTGGWEHDPNA